MSSIRTQIYLTRSQREQLDELRRRDKKSLAEVIREAIDAYLKGPYDDAEVDRMLEESYGSMPDLRVPPRSEWDRGYG